MHPYSSSCESRVKWIGGLGAISVPVAFALAQQVKASGADALWFVDYPSVLGIFGFSYGAFEVIVWRLLERIGLISTPYLGGEWVVYGNTSHDGFQKSWEGSAIIRQTWSRISISLKADQSASRSLSASFFGSSDGTEVSYEYLNEPRAGAPSSMNAHRGVARLRVESSKLLVGDYFTGRGRGEYGEVRFEKRI